MTTPVPVPPVLVPVDLWEADRTSGVFSVAFSSDGRSIVAAGNSEWLVIFDEVGARHTMQSFCMEANSVAWHGDRIVVCHDQVGMKFWDAHWRVFLGTVEMDSGTVWSVSISPVAPHWIASGADDNNVGIWTLNGEPVRTLAGHTNSVIVVQFSPDGQLLASGSADATVMLWNVHSGTLRFHLCGHTDTVDSVAFSSDGKLLASCSEHTIRVWTVGDGLLHALYADAGSVQCVSFIGTNIVLSGGCDSVVKVWQDGKLIQALPTGDRIWASCVSPDGNKVALGCDSGTVRVFRSTAPARRKRRRVVLLLLAHLRRVDVMKGYEVDYVRHHVLPELSWRLWWE